MLETTELAPISPALIHLREDAARVMVRVARNFKWLMQYQDRESTPKITLWFIPNKIERIYTQGRIAEEVTSMEFNIPRQYQDIYAQPGEQAIFPPQTLPSTGAQMWYGGVLFTAALNERWIADMNEACFTINAQSHIPRRVSP